jgi:hypothetical protein
MQILPAPWRWIPIMLMSDLERRHSGSEKTHIVVGDALHLGPETQAVRDDKAKITDLRDVNSGIIGCQ